MKLPQYSGQGTQASANLAPVDIGISDNPQDQLMLLNILSDSLYSDKISAVWREYGCNAADATTEAGHDKPIEICLPTNLDSTATIRDFGLGLSREFMTNGYTKLMVSTKRDSNEMVGCLGIGRMAGLAYGDAFSVTSWHKGVKTIYNIFRDKGMPRIAEMHSEVSDAPSGVEVKVPVRRQDIYGFTQKAERVFRYFKNPPTVHGGTLSYNRSAGSFTGTGWRYTGDGKQIAIMGNVGYELKSDSFGAGKRPELLQLGVELDFAIGDLDITPNREGLQYKDKTIKAVEAGLDVMLKEMAAVFSKKIGGATCLWDAKKAYSAVFEGTDGGYGRRSLREILDANVTWKGQKIGSGRFDIASDDPEVSLTRYSIDRWRTKPKRYTDVDEVHATDKNILVINDLKVLSPSRIREYCTSHKGAVNNIIVFSFKTDAARVKYWKETGLEGAPTMKLSDMPKPATISSVGGGPSIHRSKHSARAFVIRENGPIQGAHTYSNTANSQYWDTTSIDKKGQGVYVLIDKFVAEGYHNDVGRYASGYPATLGPICKRMREAGLLKVPVHGFKKDLADKVGSGWVKLPDYLKAELDALVKGKEQLLADCLAAYEYADLFKIKHKGVLPSGCAAWTLLHEVERMRGTNKIFHYLHTGDGVAWVKTPDTPKPTKDLAALEKKVMDRYPLIPKIPRSTCLAEKAVDFAPIAQYIKLIEKV